MRVERMYVLRLSDVEQFPIPDHLPAVAVNAQRKQFPSVQARGSQPNLLSIDHGRRPATAVYRGLPDDIPRLAPMRGQTARIRMPGAVRSAQLRPILGSAHPRTRQYQKGGEDLDNHVSLPDYLTQPRTSGCTLHPAPPKGSVD